MSDDGSGRTWLPMEWLDEYVPAGAEEPSRFLELAEDGSWHVRLPIDDPDRDDGPYDIPVVPGQVVDWSYYDDFGFVTLTVLSDGGFRSEPYPSETTHFCIDHDRLEYSMDALVKGDDFDGPLDAGSYDVHVYTWSGRVPCRFELDEAGKGRFVLVVGAH